MAARISLVMEEEVTVKESDSKRQTVETDRRHLRKPVEFKILLRPILLHVDKYSEYISDRDTEPSELVSKCAFSL